MAFQRYPPASNPAPPRNVQARGTADSGNQKMATMPDPKNMTPYGRNTANYTPNSAHPNNVGYNNQWNSRSHSGQGYGMHLVPSSEVAALAHTFQGMNIQNHSFAPGQLKHGMMAGGAYGGLAAATAMPTAMYNGSQYLYSNGYNPNQNVQSQAVYTQHPSQYYPQMGYQGYPPQMQQQQVHQHSPASANWTPPTGGANGEIPTLITPRRGSMSSNENDQPATPSYTAPSYTGYSGYAHPPVAINRSPSGALAQTTPSPSSLIGTYGMPFIKYPEQPEVSPEIKLLVNQEPAIPRAIPAPSSPSKPLDRALENPRGETNVYVRGLQPETTDEMLKDWAARFGDICSSKSIIDHKTGQCKGFGFVKYFNYDDCERCIRGFHYMGYEVSFARESFYSKLKTFANDDSTNLYVSNLPKQMNEHDLSQLFLPHVVASSRILRDTLTGHGRGVGFARFESRDVCEEVIKTFNNQTIHSNGMDLTIQIRYADTTEQKLLKQQTHAARQFRSAEYDQAVRQGRDSVVGSTGHDSQGSQEFEQCLGTVAAVPFQGQRWAQSAIRHMPGRSPLGGITVTAPNSPRPGQGQNTTSNNGEAPDHSQGQVSSHSHTITSPSDASKSAAVTDSSSLS